MLAEDTVQGEPVCTREFLVLSRKTGLFVEKMTGSFRVDSSRMIYPERITDEKPHKNGRDQVSERRFLGLGNRG